MESQEDINFTLDQAGKTLTFTGFTIKGIPGQLTFNVQSFDSPYDVEKQEFDFQISGTDFYSHTIDGQSFTYTLGTKKYTFKVVSYVDDLVGWVNLKVKLTGKANV